MKFNFREAVLAAVLALGLPAAASAATYTGLDQPGLGGAPGTNDDEYGWAFEVLTDISVTELGFYAATAGTTTLNLWAVVGQSLLASVEVTTGDTGWVFAPLDGAVVLSEGLEYVVSWGGGDLGGSFALSGEYTISPHLSYVSAQVGTTVGDYPSDSVANGAVFLADIGYELADVPVPAALPLALAGLGALALVGRRRG